MSCSFKLLVFDWDGTLMDSEARIVACATAAAADIGLEVPTQNAVRNIIGLGLKEAMLVLFPGSDEAEIARFVERYRYHFLHVDETPSPLFPGAEEVLNHLAGLDYFMAVATGKGRPGLDKVLLETGLGPLFHITRCGDEAFSKPHPGMLEQIMDVMGVEGAETLMIGDTEYDMQMASNAGAHSLAVSYGAHEVERLVKHNPLGCLDSITELTGWLDGYKLT